MQREITAFLRGRSEMAARIQTINKIVAVNDYCVAGISINKNISLVADATETSSISTTTKLTAKAEGIPSDAGMPSAARDFTHLPNKF